MILDKRRCNATGHSFGMCDRPASKRLISLLGEARLASRRDKWDLPCNQEQCAQQSLQWSRDQSRMMREAVEHIAHTHTHTLLNDACPPADARSGPERAATAAFGAPLQLVVRNSKMLVGVDASPRGARHGAKSQRRIHSFMPHTRGAREIEAMSTMTACTRAMKSITMPSNTWEKGYRNQTLSTSRHRSITIYGMRHT